MPESCVRPRSRSALLRRPVTSLTTLALLCQSIVPTYAQTVADPNAGARQPKIDRAANGTPIVNITTPNAQGLSHNQFSDFNVGPEGLVLNNSAELAASQIAGFVLGNPNLTKGSEAALILNEVTSTNRSLLSGYMEVQGRPASVIVANPNGITCSGCGFLNMPRLTLTTGRPFIDSSGTLRSFRVDDGSITIGANGLDASRVSRFELVSRLLEISGALQAQDLAISGGRQSYDYGAQTSAALPEDGRVKPQFFLDGSALGGMYAGRIRIIGNELGLGVRAPGKMLADSGDLSIDAKGRVAVNAASATGNLTIRSTDAVEVNGTTYAEGDTSVTAGTTVSIADGAVLGARNALILASQSLAVGNGIIASGLASDGTLVPNGGSAQLRIGGASTVASGGLISGGARLDFTAGSLANSGTIQADTLLALTTSGGLLNTGRLLGSNDVQLRSGGALTTGPSASIEAGRDLSLSTAAAFTSDGVIRANRDGVMSAGPTRLASLTVGRNLNLAATDLTVARNAVAGGDVTVLANNVNVSEGATLGAVGAFTLSADTVSNAGILASEAALALTGKSSPSSLVLTNAATGRLAGGTGLTASFASLQNAGLLTSDGGLALTGGNFSNTKEVTAKGGLTLRAGPVVNSGVVSAATLDIATDAVLTNAGSGVLQATDTVRVASTSLTNAGRIVSNGAVALGLDTLNNQGGTIVAGTDLAIGGRTTGSSAALIHHVSGQIGSVSGDTRLAAAALDNQAAITAGRDLLMTVSGRVDGSAASRFEAGRDLTLTGTAALGSTGTLRADRDLQLAAASITALQISSGANLRLAGTSLDNVGNIVAGGTADLRFTNSLTNRTGSTIGGVAGLSIVSPSIDNAGTLASEAAVLLAGANSGIAGRLNNRASGRISGATGLNATFAGLDNAGVVTSARDLSLTGLDLINTKEITGSGTVALRFASIDQSGLTSGRVLTIADADKVEIGTTGVLQATDAISIAADSVNNLGLIASGGTLLASVSDLTNDHASIISRGNLTIEGLTPGSRAGMISNMSGDIESVQGNISLAASLVDNVGDAVTELRTTEIRHQFAQSRPPAGIAYYPDLISRAGYFQLYDEGRTRSYVWVPSPEKVDEILAATGKTIDQWTPTMWQDFAPDPATFNPDEWVIYVPDEARNAPAGSYIAARDESDVVIRQNAPGRIVTGAGNINIDAGVLRNTQSTISVNGDLALIGGSVINEGKTLNRSYSLTLSFNNDTVRGEGWVHPGGGATAWFARGNRGPLLARQEITGVIPSTINATGSITGNLAGSFVNVGTPATDPATLSFANTSTTLVTVTQAPPATSVSMAALAGTSGTGADVNASAAPIPTSIRIPESQLRQFAPADPGSRFVIETRLQFINLADYFGSEYFFSRLGTRPDDDIKALGDAYFDFLLIRDQIVELTGKRFVDPVYATEQAQAQSLIAAGAELVRSLGLKAGEGLTPDQVAKLKQDVVIYQDMTFKGQRVLIPHLYLAASSAVPNDGRSARVNARILDIASAVLVNSNGTLEGTDRLRIATSGDTISTGGLFTGQSVEFDSRGTIALAPILTTTGNGTTRVGTIVGARSEITTGGSVQLRAPTISVVGSQIVAGDNIKIEAERLNISPAEAFTRQKYADKNVKFDVSRNTLLLSNVQAGGSIDISATDTAFIRAATLKAGEDVRIHAGELFITSGQEESQNSGQFNKRGFTKSTTQWDHIAVTQVPSVIDAGRTLELAGTVGDLAVTASILKGENVSLQAAGQVRLEVAYNERFDSDSKQGGNLLITSSKAQGVKSETIVSTQIYANDISINAKQGLVLQFKQTGNLDESIAQLAQFPGLSYLEDLKNTPGVDYQGMRETFEKWKYSQTGLSGPAAALIVIAVSIALPNPAIFSAQGLSGLGALAAPTAAGLNAGLSALVRTAATSLLTNGGDLGATLRDISSADGIKAIATQAIISGVLQGLSQNDLYNLDPQTALERVRAGLTRAGVNSTVETAVNGGSFTDNLHDSLLYDAALTVGGITAREIGDAAKTGQINEAARLIAQSALGCGIAAATSSTCTSGAVSALAAELAAGSFLHGVDPSRTDLDAIRQQGIDVGKLTGAVAAFIAGGDVMGGAAIGENVTRENSLRLAVSGLRVGLRLLRVARATGALSEAELAAAGMAELEAIELNAGTLISADTTLNERLLALYDLTVGIHAADFSNEDTAAVALASKIKGLRNEDANSEPKAPTRSPSASEPTATPPNDPDDPDDFKEPNKAGLDDRIDLGRFIERVRGSSDKVDPETGYRISPDRGGDRAHGGSAYKLVDEMGKRVATLDKSGRVIRK